MKTRIRIQGLLITGLTLGALLFYKFFFLYWRQERFDEIADFIGVLFLLLGYLIRLSARGDKSLRSKGGHILVTDGLYREMRNPMYLGTICIGSGIVLILFKFWVFLAMLAVLFMIYEIQTRKEEQFLLTQFGQDYQNYKAATPKYFPKRIKVFLAHITNPSLLEWPRLKKEIRSFLGVFLGVAFVEAYADARAFGFNGIVHELIEFIWIIAALLLVLYLIARIQLKFSKAL